ncbi:hypothetical protein MKW98_025261, partial [Papaver atlanticum]
FQPTKRLSNKGELCDSGSSDDSEYEEFERALLIRIRLVNVYLSNFCDDRAALISSAKWFALENPDLYLR